jgi:hypothetical protein
MAVLFRINAQSPVVELALAQARIPYQVRGAERFFERPEVRQGVAAIRAAARAEGGLEGLPRARDTLSALGWAPDPPNGAGRVRNAGVPERPARSAGRLRRGRTEPPTLDDLVAEPSAARRWSTPVELASPCRRCTRPKA